MWYCIDCHGGLYKDRNGGWWCEYCWKYSDSVERLLARFLCRWWKKAIS